MRFIFLSLIRVYQLILSPFLSPCCRFLPTCSQYAYEAFSMHGFFKGFFLTIKRISRCHPWGGEGFDPVPLKLKNERNSHE